MRVGDVCKALPSFLWNNEAFWNSPPDIVAKNARVVMQRVKACMRGMVGLLRNNGYEDRHAGMETGYWAVTGSGILTHTITNKRLVAVGCIEILNDYESLYLCN